MSELINTYLGQFRITELIHRGDTITIYKAYQPALDRFVAIKVLPPLPPAYDPHFAIHFKLAAQEIAKVHHPNILRIHDYNEQDGLRYLVLQHIEGGAVLADILGKPLELTTVVQLAGHLLDALDYAHQRGVIHGDIKPTNILLSESGWPLLTDFGIVKRMNDSQRLMLSEQVVGDPPYMAPEVASGRLADARTDLYALGVVLYELLTGQVPFDAELPKDILTKHVYEPPPPPRRFNAAVPAAIEAVVLRALAKDPAARYQSAAEMAKELTLGAGQLPHNRTGGQLTSLYQSGVQAFAAGRWDVAIERLSQVVALEPGYEDATELLETAQDARERTKREAQRQLALMRQQHQSTDQSQFQPTPTSTPTPTTTRETVEFAPIAERTTVNLSGVAVRSATSTEENKALVRRWIEETWNKGSGVVWDELLATISSEETKQAVIGWRSAFPDGYVTIEEMIAEGDTVVVRWTFRGTQQGEFQAIAPTGQPLTIPGFSIDRIAEGKIVHATNWTIVQQPGVLPFVGQAAS
jgi:serine/threonine-protein kinase